MIARVDRDIILAVRYAEINYLYKDILVINLQSIAVISIFATPLVLLLGR